MHCRYAEYFKYKVYFCKGDIEMRAFIFTCWCCSTCFVAVDPCESLSFHQLCFFDSLKHFCPFLFKTSNTVASLITRMDFNLASLQPPSSHTLAINFDEKRQVFSNEAQKHLSKLQLCFCLACFFIFLRKPFPALWNSSTVPPWFKIMRPTSQVTITCHVAALFQPQ